jgi:hypothetical protein
MMRFRTSWRTAAGLALLVALGAGGMASRVEAASAVVKFTADRPNVVVFPAQQARFVRLTINASIGGQPCIDELELYAQESEHNLALASRGAKATASSCMSGVAIHKVAHLNDGQYGNSHSWIAAGGENEWAQIELPESSRITKLVFSRDRLGDYHDRLPQGVLVSVSEDGVHWKEVCQLGVKKLTAAASWSELLEYAFLCERDTWQRMDGTDHLSPLVTDRAALPGGKPYWSRVATLEPLERVLVLMEEMADRMASKGLDVAIERAQLAEFRRRQAGLGAAVANEEAADSLYDDVRLAKRQLMLRDPDLNPAQRILFAKRHPYLASHNYSDVLDSQFRAGGGICRLDIPRRDGRLEPSEAVLTTLFDATDGIARDPIADFSAEKIYFAYRPSKSPVPGESSYWHLMSMNADGQQSKQISDGPFNDFFPCPLPDGGLAFISTRCRARFLCWRPQAFVLFRMDPDGSPPKPLSFANLSEWTPTVNADGLILWTRSEYLDKGANFGHTLWTIHADGTHPELVFGNNTNNCYMNAHEVPGSREILCTLVSHGGDHNGPIALIDRGKDPSDSTAVTNITPDVKPQYDMTWIRHECFRDPIPLSRDYFLVSHAPADTFGLYLIDRYGNRELLYLDPTIGSMRPRPLRAVAPPPVLSERERDHNAEVGQFNVVDVYEGLANKVPRGKVKYLRVCEEVRAGLEQMPNGEYARDSGPDFQDFYATPIHKVTGPYGWPSYVAKASLGLAPVEEDGSANFYVPAGRVIYFQALDAEFNELQRMRSVVQLQPGETRSCVGCHDKRKNAPPVPQTIATRRAPSKLEAPPWGAEAFSYEKVVQPVWNSACVKCHGESDKQNFNLSGKTDSEGVPASYRTLISGGWVHYFDCSYGQRHHEAEPMTFGTLESKLWKVLDKGHYDVDLTAEQKHRIKCWTDLNCPLWPDYQYRPTRPALSEK